MRWRKETWRAWGIHVHLSVHASPRRCAQKEKKQKKERHARKKAEEDEEDEEDPTVVRKRIRVSGDACMI